MYKHQLAQELKTVLTSTLIIYVCLLNLLLLPLEAIRSSLLLLSVIQRYVAALAGADADSVLDGDDAYAAVANLTRAGSVLDGLHGLLDVLVADNDIQHHSLNTARVVSHTTIDSGLTHLALSSAVEVGEPFDVGTKERFLDLLKLGLADNCFNLLHVYLSLLSVNNVNQIYFL